MTKSEILAIMGDALGRKAREATAELGSLYDREAALSAIAGVIPSATVIGPVGPSNSSDVLKIAPHSELWLSIYGKLATIVGENEVDAVTLLRLKNALAVVNWILIPQWLVAEPIDKHVDCAWFTELFDYF